MSESSIEALSLRMDRLDRENRRLKRIVLSLLLAVAGLGVAGAATFEEREILIRDPNNNAVRIKLTTNPENGSAGIEIYDRQGRRRIVLGTRADDDLPGLFYFDQNGNSKRQDND